MATDTFHVRATFLDAEPLPNIEASIAAAPAADQGMYLKHVPFLCIFNDPASGKIVKIKRVSLRTVAGQGQTTLLPSNMQLNLISAITVDGETIVPAKMSSSASDPPSQVKIQQYAVTTPVSDSELRRLHNYPVQNMTRALAPFVTPKFQTGEWSRGDYACQGVTGYVLAEGEGITIRNADIPFSMAWRVFILFTIGVTTYVVSEVMRSVDDQRNLFTIFNGSGSGVSVNVRQITVMEAGTDEVPFVSMYRVDSHVAGEALTTMKMDSNSTMPSSVRVRTRGVATLYGYNYGAVIANPKYRRVPLNTWGTGPGLAGVDMKSQLETMLIFDNVACCADNEPITLRAGEGIAMFQNENASGLGRWTTSVTFTVENVPASGGSTYSRGRVVNG